MFSHSIERTALVSNRGLKDWGGVQCSACVVLTHGLKHCVWHGVLNHGLTQHGGVCCFPKPWFKLTRAVRATGLFQPGVKPLNSARATEVCGLFKTLV